jgi:SAM-dependent methyltransferase
MNKASGVGEDTSGRQSLQAVCRPAEGLTCPGCRGLLSWNGTDLHCQHCGRTARVHAGRIPDFLTGGDSVAEVILGWPDDFVQYAEPWLLAVASDKPVSTEASAELQAKQLMEGERPRGQQSGGKRHWRLDAGSRLTALGSNLAYHCAEFAVQCKRDKSCNFLRRFVQLSALGSAAAVLDVGCGAGQTLRQFEPYQPAERVGFDIDLEALAFGCRLAESRGDTIYFVRASAYQIPFPDKRFSHVVCRIALNYLHQARALREMVRVLQPGGHLYCSVEGPGFDIDFLRQARTATQVLCRLRDVFYGLILALAGVQPTPGNRLTGGRAFATVRRCSRTLKRAGCEVIRAEVNASRLGMPMGFDLVARKR